METATAKAFPGIEHTWTRDGQWLMRAGDGITERSNSAAPLGRSAGFGQVPLDEIRAFYERHNLPVKVLIPERIGAPAEKLVESGGWELGPEIIVMTRELTALDLPAAEYTFRIDDQPDDDWLALYHFRGQPLPVHALRLLQDQIDGEMGFGRLLAPAGRPSRSPGVRSRSSEDGRVWPDTRPSRWRKLIDVAASAPDSVPRCSGAPPAAPPTRPAGHRLQHGGPGAVHQLGFIEHHRHRYARRES